MAYDDIVNPGNDVGYEGVVSPEYEDKLGQLRSMDRPLLERRNKLMDQIYEPDHLSFGGAVAQALVGFLPAILGKTLAGNVGGAIGAKAGLEGLGTYDTISKAYRADEQKQGLAQVKSIDDERAVARDLEKTLLTGGIRSKEVEEQRKYEDTRRRPGGDIYDFERQKMAQQHGNRMSEIAFANANDGNRMSEIAFANANDGNNNKLAEPALIASTKLMIEQRVPDPTTRAMLLEKLDQGISNRGIEELSRQLALRDPEKRALQLAQPGKKDLYNSVIKPAKQKLDDEYNSLASLKMMLNDKTGVTVGALRGQWATSIAGEGSRKTDEDINRNLTPNAWSKITEIENYFSKAPAESPLSSEYKQMIDSVLNEIGNIHLQKYKQLDRELETYAPDLSSYANQQNPGFYSDWTAPGKERANKLFGNSPAPSAGKQYPPDQEALIQKRLNEKLAAAGRR